jgi:hypothetical protein
VRRLLAGLVLTAAFCGACSSGSADHTRRLTGVEGVDGSTWDVELVAAVRGFTDNQRGDPRPCLMLFVVVKATTSDQLTVPGMLQITATVNGTTSSGEYSGCSVDGELMEPADPYGEWPGQIVAPGAEFGFAVGFTDFEGEVHDSVQVVLGVGSPRPVEIVARVLDEAPPLPGLAIGSVPETKPADSEFRFVYEGDVATQQVLGYDVVPGSDGRSCVRLYVRAVVNIDVVTGPMSLLPSPELMVNGVSTGTWPGGCASAEGFFHLSPGSPTDPWPANVPYGVMYSYSVPVDATVQAVLIEDEEQLTVLAVERLGGPPPAP